MSAKRPVTFSQTFVKQSGYAYAYYINIKIFHLVYHGKYLWYESILFLKSKVSLLSWQTEQKVKWTLRRYKEILFKSLVVANWFSLINRAKRHQFTKVKMKA